MALSTLPSGTGGHWWAVAWRCCDSFRTPNPEVPGIWRQLRGAGAFLAWARLPSPLEQFYCRHIDTRPTQKDQYPPWDLIVTFGKKWACLIFTAKSDFFYRCSGIEGLWHFNGSVSFSFLLEGIAQPSACLAVSPIKMLCSVILYVPVRKIPVQH